jgi:P4 family phage/plasmid primase-like protien
VNLPEDDKRQEMMGKRVEKILTIVSRLGKTGDKKNIMIEAKDKFYDSDFLKQLDTNPWLMCFKNGVWDFKDGLFRDGKPDDFISLSTGIDYVKIDHKKDEPEIQEMKLFMQQLFPIPELEKYMWQHLASSLIGTSANQTFNNYIGEGSNGKSVLTSLMGMILGDYKGDLPHTAITQQRTKVGGLAPEIVALRGKRYVVMQEPSKGDAINEGIMKQFTSGVEPIIARAPYMIAPLHFIPQFKLVVCANQFLKINSNDHGTWRRIRVPKFLSLFTHNPVDDDLEKPYQFKMIPDIERKFEDKLKYIFMGLLVEIALEKKGVVEDCPTVLGASDAYRQSQDVVSEFINEKIVVMNGASIKKTALNFEFQQWHLNTYGRNGPQPKEVHSYMDKKYGKSTSKGWSNVKIKQENEIDIDDDEEDDGSTFEAEEIEL